jgi:hypothetical protein
MRLIAHLDTSVAGLPAILVVVRINSVVIGSLAGG